MIPHHVAYPIVCGLCNRPAAGHNRATGECNVYARSATKPYALGLRKRPVAAAGWRVR